MPTPRARSWRSLSRFGPTSDARGRRVRHHRWASNRPRPAHGPTRMFSLTARLGAAASAPGAPFVVSRLSTACYRARQETRARDSTPPASVAHPFARTLSLLAHNDARGGSFRARSPDSPKRGGSQVCVRSTNANSTTTSSTRVSFGYRPCIRDLRLARAIDARGVSRRHVRFGDPRAHPAGSVHPRMVRIARPTSDAPVTAPSSPIRSRSRILESGQDRISPQAP